MDQRAVIRISVDQGNTVQATQHVARALGQMSQAGVISAGQTANAFRQLPAQFTDIATQLAGGQSPFLILLQQGGQIKDSFGGIAPAARALLGLLTPARLALGGVAAGVVALTLGYAQGRAEGEAYNRALINTRNAAGTTADELANMAVRLAGVAGSQSRAADALAQLAGTGRVTAGNLELVATATVALKRTAGQDVADTVKIFEDLGKSPVEASLKLTAQYRYLTAETYKQIQSLVNRNRIQEAGDIAQRAFAEDSLRRAAQIESKLGTLAKAWRGVTEGAVGAWNAMVGPGREQTFEDKLAKVRANIEGIQGRLRIATRDGTPINRDARDLAEARDAEEAIKENIRLRNRQTSQQASALATQEEDLRKAAEGERIRKQVQSANRAAGIATVKDLLKSETDAYSSADKTLELLRGAGLVSEANYFESKRQFIALTSAVQVAALEAETRVLNSQKFKSDELAERIARDSQVSSNRKEVTRLQNAATADSIRLTLQETIATTAASRATQQYLAQLRETAAARLAVQRLQVQGVGQSDLQRQASAFIASENARFNDEVRKLQDERDNNKLTATEFEGRTNALQKYHNSALSDEAKFQQDLLAAQADGMNGAVRAFQNYVDAGRNVAGQVEQAFTNGFKGIEDALVSFSTTGKLNFKQLADSIIGDLIRIQVRSQLTSVFAGVSGLLTGGVGGGILNGALEGGLKNVAGRARGGSVEAYNTYIVGEAGPELLRMGPLAGTVIPSGPTQQMLGGRGTMIDASINGISVGAGVSRPQMYAAISQAQSKMEERLLRMLRQQGTL